MIEIGAVALEQGIVVAEFTSLIDTGTAISRDAFRVHGISRQMLAGEPTPDKVWPDFADFVGNSCLVAHNASFDRPFILHELALWGLSLPNQWHCTVQLSRRKLYNLPNHRLDTVYQHLFGPLPHNINRHRALDDARMAARIWGALSEAA